VASLEDRTLARAVGESAVHEAVVVQHRAARRDVGRHRRAEHLRGGPETRKLAVRVGPRPELRAPRALVQVDQRHKDAHRVRRPWAPCARRVRVRPVRVPVLIPSARPRVHNGDLPHPARHLTARGRSSGCAVAAGVRTASAAASAARAGRGSTS
jgi:hypothetical protein